MMLLYIIYKQIHLFSIGQLITLASTFAKKNPFASKRLKVHVRKSLLFLKIVFQVSSMVKEMLLNMISYYLGITIMDKLGIYDDKIKDGFFIKQKGGK